MREHLGEAWQTLVPPRDGPHGPLPALLVVLTVVAGLVDAFSYLELRRVFVANMTGNVVFLGFALGRSPGFVWWASLLAIAAFVLGAHGGGRITHVVGAHRARHLCAAALAQAVLVLTAFLLALATSAGTGPLLALIVLLGLGMGVQNATARALAVPDLTATTVLTTTITGISADSAAAGGGASKAGRRLVSVVSMLVGGLAGALLIHAGGGPWVLLVAAALLCVVVVVTSRALGSTEAWTAKRG